MTKWRLGLAAVFLLWAGFVLAAIYVVQRPLALQVGAGLASAIWALALTGVLLADAAGLGGWICRSFFPFLDGGERVFFGTGLGLGIFGLSGFGLAACGLARPYVLLPILAGLLVLAAWRGWLRRTRADCTSLWQVIRSPLERKLAWIPWLAGLALFLSFLLAFAPPADSFDALFYHLTVPALWIKDGGLVASQLLPHYWFPELVEGAFVWGLALGSEVVAQLLHLAWGVLTVGLVWWWAQKAWGNSPAWRSTAVLVSMPSLPLIAAWAYTDLALAFTCAAVLYLVWSSLERPDRRLWVLSGIFCGLAMGIKYTSFILPLVVIAWLAWTQRRHPKGMLAAGALFSLAAILVACPWYVRSWVWTGNPFYPFIFGGRFWDAVHAAHYPRPGAAVGFNLLELILLPLSLTLGQRDANFFDGRVGPLWLVLLPACLWVLWKNRRGRGSQALQIPVLFGAASLGLWVIGAFSMPALWQSRLLFPALIPLAPLAALAWDALSRLDTRRFKVSFIFSALAALSILAGLLDFGLFVLVRNPLAAAVGITNRQAYFERFQPAYGDALALVGRTPPGARVYFLFEPRSYGMSRTVQPDAINDNLAHDFTLYHTPQGVLEAWKSQGYTYVLYQHVGDELLENAAESQRLFAMLDVVAETPNTVLYRIPTP